MDEDAVRQLVSEELGNFQINEDAFISVLMDKVTEAIAEYVDGAIAEVKAELQATGETAEAATETATEVVEEMVEPETNKDDPLALRVQELEKKLAEKYAQEENMAADNALRKAISSYKPLHPSMCFDILKMRLGKLEKKKGTYYDHRGKTLKECCQAFFESEEGKHLLPAPSEGVALTETKVSAPVQEYKTVQELLMEAFS